MYRNGHHAVMVAKGSDNLVTDFSLKERWIHDLSVDGFAALTVRVCVGSCCPLGARVCGVQCVSDR